MGEVKRLDKPNQLIQIIASSEITALQRKLYNFLLKKAQYIVTNDDREIDPIQFYNFNMDINELLSMTEFNTNNYDYIMDSLDELVGIRVSYKDVKDGDDWNKGVRGSASLLGSFHKEGSDFTFSLYGKIVKALKERQYFTKFDLLQIARLKSKYSIILYELAKRYYCSDNKDIKIPKMTMEEFRDLTGTSDKYKSMVDFRKYVLDRACQEITEKTDIILEYQTFKTGRRISHIDFKTIKKDKLEGFDDEVNNLYELLPEKEQFESNKKILDKLYKEYGFRYVKGHIKYVKNRNDIETFMGYLKTACKQGYAKKDIEDKKRKEKVKEDKRAEKIAKDKISKQMNKMAEVSAKMQISNLSKDRKQEFREKYDNLRNKDKVNLGDRTDKMWADNNSFEEFLFKVIKSEILEEMENN